MKHFVSALLLVLFISASVMAQMDNIQLLEGKGKRCKILKMTATELTVDDGGVEEVVPVNKIKMITFNREPAQFAKARDYIANGSNEDALALLDANVRGTAGDSKALNQEMDYLIARASANIALAGGEVTKEKAVGLAEAFVKNNSKNFHFYDACEMTGDLYAAINTPASFKKAAIYYGQLSKAPWEDMKMRSYVAMGKIFLVQKDVAKAKKAYESVLACQERGVVADRMRLISKMGLAKCAALSGNTDGAIKMVEEVLKNSRPEDSTINALGYNALGLAYMAANKDKEAIAAFLQVDLLYSRDVPSHIEALQNLRTLWQKLSMQNRVQECTDKLNAYGVNK